MTKNKMNIGLHHAQQFAQQRQREEKLREIEKKLEDEPDEILNFQNPTNLSVQKSNGKIQIEEYVIKIHSIKIDESKHLWDFYYQTPPDIITFPFPKSRPLLVHKLEDIGTIVNKGEYIRIKNECQKQESEIQRKEKYDKSLKGRIHNKSIKIKEWIKEQKILGGITIGFVAAESKDTILYIFTELFTFITKLF